MDKHEAIFLTKLFLKHHEMVLSLIFKESGIIPRKYKKLEAQRLISFFSDCFVEDKNQLEEVSHIMSNLVLIQALPNANHRTTTYFIQTLLTKNGFKFPTYDAKSNWEKWQRDCDAYFRESKYLLSIMNEKEILKRQYACGIKFKRLRKNDFKEIYIEDLFCSEERLKEKHEEITKKWLKDMLKNQSIILAKAGAVSLKNLIVSSLNTISSSDNLEAS